MGRDDSPSTPRARWKADRTTFQRVYDSVVGAREFEPVATVADRAGCSEAGARSALEQLAEMGIVERREGRPVGYRRNDSYFRWKRIEELAHDHTADELRETVDDLIEADRRFQEAYGVPDPDAIAPDAFTGADHVEVHDLWEDVTEWRTIRRDIELLQRAAHRADVSEANDTVSA